MNRFLDYLRRAPARVYAVVVAVVALVAVYVNVPAEQILGVVAALLALASGEAVQRVENRKTVNGG